MLVFGLRLLAQSFALESEDAVLQLRRYVDATGRKSATTQELTYA